MLALAEVKWKSHRHLYSLHPQGNVEYHLIPTAENTMPFFENEWCAG